MSSGLLASWGPARRAYSEAQDQINGARANPTDVELETKLSDAALQATPAVKQYGTPTCRLCGAPYGTDDPHHCINADAIVLTGPEAERYRALQAAARAAQESAKAAQVASTALREAFQTFCAGVG